jgi:predicted ATP-dependent serine protease
VRPVIHAGPRLKEAGKLGFRYAVLPQMQQTRVRPGKGTYRDIGFSRTY